MYRPEERVDEAMLNAVEKDLIRLERDMEASIERVALADGVMGSRRRDEQNQQKKSLH